MARISFVDEITVTQKPEAELPEKAIKAKVPVKKTAIEAKVNSK